jgi:hypothetical protein
MKALLLILPILGGCWETLPKRVEIPVAVSCAKPPPLPALVTDKDMRAAKATNGQRWIAALNYQESAGPHITELRAALEACSR